MSPDARHYEPAKKAAETLDSFKNAALRYKEYGEPRDRSDANRLVPRVQKILRGCGVSNLIEYRPPPMIGGSPILADAISEWDNEFFLTKVLPTTIDRIDHAHGVIDSGEYPPEEEVEEQTTQKDSSSDLSLPQETHLKENAQSLSVPHKIDLWLTRLTSVWFLITAPFRLPAAMFKRDIGLGWSAVIILIVGLAIWLVWYFYSRHLQDPFQQFAAPATAGVLACAIANAVITQVRHKD